MKCTTKPDLLNKIESNQQLRATGDMLRKSEERYRATFEQAAVGIARVGPDGEWLDVNEKLCSIVGYSRDKLMMKTFQDITHPDDLDADLAFVNQMLNDEIQTYTMEKRYLRKDGSIIWINLTVGCVRNSNRTISYFVSVVEDIDARKQAEEALKAANQQLAASNQQLNATEQQLRASNQQLKATEQQLRASNQQLEASNQQLRATGDMLRKSEERYRATFEQAAVGIARVGPDGEWLDVNEKLCSIVGYSRDKLMMKTFQDITHPDDLDADLAFVNQMLNDEIQTYTMEKRYLRKDGSIIWINLTVGCVRNSNRTISYFVSVVEDISERRQTEERLHRLAAAIDQVDESVEITDADPKILYVNPAFEKITGYLKEEIIGKNPKFLQSGNHNQAFYQEMWSALSDGKVWRGRFENKRKDGTLFYEDTSITPVVDNNGKIINYVAVKRDITKELEQEKKIAQAQKMESVGNLAGGIAHDFNNILSSIIGFTELALDDVDKDSLIEDNLQEVYTAGKRAKDLVGQILAFARQSEEEKKPIQVDLIVKEVLQFIRSSIPTDIEIKKNIDSDSLIMGNQTQVHQILMNLCTNAAHAMEADGGILDVTLKDMVVDKSVSKTIDLKPGNYIKLTVSDTGTGIPPDIIDSIFEPYFTTKNPGEGTGMGLAMVQGIIESYGGNICVNSVLTKGTTFTIYIPVARKRKIQRQYEPEHLPKGTERILFVDDEAPIAKMGSQSLERLGYLVTTRTSSVEALELFRSKPDEFDLVITDMTMPNMTGDKLAVELMKIRQDIPMILCTGYRKKISDDSAAEIGIKAFAYKPIVKADLAKTIRKVLDEAKGPAHA